MEKAGIIIVGGGVAGLAAAVKIAKQKVPVRIFSPVRLRRSYSVNSRDGINAALNTKGEADSVERHVQDTLSAGCSLAGEDRVMRMCRAAPGSVHLLERMGVPFNRTREGILELRLSAGSEKKRNVYAGDTTGQKVLSMLDSQVRRCEAAGQVKRFEFWHLASFVKNGDGRCTGITAINMRNMNVKPFSADAVILSSGGYGGLFGASHLQSNGAFAMEAYKQGAVFANPEFVQLEKSPYVSAGGIYVDDHHQTGVPGLFAIGECSCLYHGAGRLEGNSILSEIFSGFQAADYLAGLVPHSDKTEESLFENEVKKQDELNKALALQEGEENIYGLKHDLEIVMQSCVGAEREESKLKKADVDIQVLMERSEKCGSTDTSKWGNREVLMKRDFKNMAALARIVALAALARNESRGAHFRKDFPERNDKEWRKVTKVEYSPDKPKLNYEKL